MAYIDRDGRLGELQRARTEAMKAGDMIAYWAIDIAICRHLNAPIDQSLGYLQTDICHESVSKLIGEQES